MGPMALKRDMTFPYQNHQDKCKYYHQYIPQLSLKIVTDQAIPTWVAAARAGVFAILVSKFRKITKIFQQLYHLRSQWVLCQS